MAGELFRLADYLELARNGPIQAFSSLEIRVQALQSLRAALQMPAPTQLLGFARSHLNLQRLIDYVSEQFVLQPDLRIRHREVMSTLPCGSA
ncbi:hypothetical protein D3C77_12070 [compost metagenome]|uniref:hypothetical protein n=1 Tax=Pseudomonas TaxID=286 RepID=UPI000406CCE6|nr:MULTISPECIES: hypothetical protein [Pseudomonas]MCW2267366.1 hypothetical protein [Pseudomonas sp. JUb96]PRA69417.1 hypothetical protein CQ065_07525 [Pseudomonas sp. MYb187]